MKWSEQAKEFNMRAMERVYRERQEGKEIYPPDNLIYRAIQPNSHAKWEWKDFTGEILRAASRLPQPFRGSKPFSTANKLLIEMGGEPIEWKI